MLNANSVLPADALVVMLRESSSTAVQSSILGALANYRFEELNEDYQRYLSSRLEEWAHNSPDPALLSQARSCLQRWKPAQLHALNRPLTTPDQQWFTTSLGQPMVVVDPPDLIQVGKENYKRIWTRIGRRYALSVHEVTGAEFEQFRADPRVKAWIAADPSTRNFNVANGNMPQTASWIAAQLYCQWLNEREGIREDQWCYKDVWNPHGKITPAPNYISLTGYRLPTQAEREWACRAGSTEPWHFGSDEAYTDRFEWTMPHSMDRPQPVGTKRPNLFGLFDMGGNLAEWADNSATPPYRSDDTFFIEDRGSKTTSPTENRVLSGGRYRFSSTSAQSNSSVLEPSNYVSVTVGFRIARTVPQ